MGGLVFFSVFLRLDWKSRVNRRKKEFRHDLFRFYQAIFPSPTIIFHIIPSIKHISQAKYRNTTPERMKDQCRYYFRLQNSLNIITLNDFIFRLFWINKVYKGNILLDWLVLFYDRGSV